MNNTFYKSTLTFLLTLFTVWATYAQNNQISGSITDENSEPIPGATILLKGTSIGTTTNLDGNYQIEASAEGILVFSFIGYESQEILVGNQKVINVILQPTVSDLEEVVVVGYGTLKKRDVTGSMANIDPKDQSDVPNTNILQIIKGNTPGVNIGTPNSPGAEPSFQIRGTNSIATSAGAMATKNEPLIVVDGIIYWGSLNNLNVNDIASVEVLKDASAAAIYGSRSANGVILVTTKEGTSEKPEFRFNGKFGVSNPVKLIPVLNGEQYLQKMLDFREANGQEADPNKISEYLTVTEANNLANGKTIDWYDRLVQPAKMSDFTGSVSGKSKKTSYYLSGSVLNQNGIVENDNFKRISTVANFKNEITDWFSIGLKSFYSFRDYSGVKADLSYGLSPYSNWYKDGADSGELEYYPMEDAYFRHPMLNLEIDDVDKRHDLRGTLSTVIKAPFIPGLQWTMNYSRNFSLNKRFQFQDNTLAMSQNGYAFKRLTTFSTWTWDNILNYNKVLNEKHNINGTFLISREYQTSDATEASANDFFSQALGYNNLGLGAVPQVSSSLWEKNQNALMGRVNYGYDNRFNVTGTVRRDGFSGFAKGNKYATFYSGAASWTVSNEAFLQNVEWLEWLKLRMSYGENGNQAIQPYQTLASLETRNYVYGNGGSTANGVYVSSMANNSLGWETTKGFNYGVDFDLMNRILYGSIDIYSTKTNDLLLPRGLPGITGFSSIFTNIGEISNKGVEIALGSEIINNGDFKWDVNTTFTSYRNKIVSLFGGDEDGDGVEDDIIANSWFIGKPLGAIFGYGIDGIHQIGDDDIPSGYNPGDFRIVDYDNDGELTADDRHILGYNTPNYMFSVSTKLRYKNWSLFAMINSIQGGGKDNYYQGNNLIGHSPNAPFASWSERFSFPAMDYWTPSNPSNTAAIINYVPPRGHPYLEDRSFVRLQDVILSYNFPKELLDKLQLGGLRMYVSGKNLYTWTKWTGYDPENATTINNAPMLRSFTAGIDLNF